jgi:hypothetical protein
MDASPGSPWVKSKISSLPKVRRTLSPSSLGGDGQKCLLRYALSAMDGTFMKYLPPSPYSSWGTVYHALKEKAFTREEYDLTLDTQLEAEDLQNSMDWIRRRLVPLADIPSIRNKIAVHRKRVYDKLPSSASTAQVKSKSGFGNSNPKYIREKFLPERDRQSVLPFRGRIDCLVQHADGTYEIWDYKTGSLHELNSMVIKSAYVRQLHAYALLAREAYGRLPRCMKLIGENENHVCVEFSDEIATAVLAEAHAVLDSIDDALRCFISGGALLNFCAPSPAVCQFCQVKPYCPGYWKSGGLIMVSDYIADLKGTIASSFEGYSAVGDRADIMLCVGEGRFISLLFTKESVTVQPVLAEWVAGRITHGMTIYVLSATRTPSPTQVKVREDTVICTDGY